MDVLVYAIGFTIFAYRFFWKTNLSKVRSGPGYELISHRGLSYEWPENTMESFLGAVGKGFKWIEMDVICTRDDTLVCAHNYDLERETDIYGYIHQINLNRVKMAFTGVNRGYPVGCRIPTLVEVLNRLPEDIGINIEIKTCSVFDFKGARALKKVLKNYKSRNVIVSSFNPMSLFVFKAQLGAAPIGLLLESTKYLWTVNWLQPNFLHIRADMINESFLALSKRRGVGIIAWTVNNREAIKFCFNNEIRGVITDWKEAKI